MHVLGFVGNDVPIYPHTHTHTHARTHAYIHTYIHTTWKLEVRSKMLRNTAADNPALNTTQNLLSETVLNELDSTLQPTVNATDSDTDGNGELDQSLQSNISVLDNSITNLKQAINTEPNPPKATKNNKSQFNKPNRTKQCSDDCKVKKTSKKKYAEIQCVFCIKWYHETCVGIKENDPIGVWICPVCRNVPSEIKNDISSWHVKSVI